MHQKARRLVEDQQGLVLMDHPVVEPSGLLVPGALGELDGDALVLLDLVVGPAEDAVDLNAAPLDQVLEVRAAVSLDADRQKASNRIPGASTGSSFFMRLSPGASRFPGSRHIKAAAAEKETRGDPLGDG